MNGVFVLVRFILFHYSKVKEYLRKWFGSSTTTNVHLSTSAYGTSLIAPRMPVVEAVLPLALVELPSLVLE